MPNWLHRVNLRKVGIFVVSLFLFILAIYLLKSGAKVLVPFIRDGLRVSNPWNALGFGWLFAYVVLSGSPVAATALTFFDVGAIDRLGTFAMIAGSRFGSSFIVLGLGFIYALRGHERRVSVAMGLLSFLVTYTIYIPALALGYWLLQVPAFVALRPPAQGGFASVMDAVFAPIVAGANQLALMVLPKLGAQISVFVLGFAVLWFSLNLIDESLPDMKLKESAFGDMARLLYRPIITFALGAAITSVTMSVSVSLAVLVPLSARGYIRRENVIPYIMGANITTFIDTLVASLLISNPGAFTVVLAEMLTVAAVSVSILAFGYRPYERAILRAATVIGETKRNLIIFLLVSVAVPVALMLIR